MRKTPTSKAKQPRVREPGHVTIADVARDAGVSKTSVSRYLGGEIALLAEGTRTQIESSIARLGYQPNQMARGLKRGRTRLIGMVVADVLNPYSVAVLNGAEAACQEHGYTLMLCNTANDEQRERQSLAALRSYSVEGLLVHTQGRSLRELQQLAAGPIPVVLIDRKLAGLQVDLVGLDNHHAARMATRHLMDQGFT
jgi:LacI family kdg operon repressor